MVPRECSSEPLPAVHLTLTLPDGNEQQLGVFRPDGDDLGFSITVQVPATTGAGVATIRDDRRPAASFTFRVGP